MLKRIEEKGLDGLTNFDLRRVKRLITRDKIKANNLSASEDD